MVDPETPKSVVIIGGGQAGLQTASSLRRLGYSGAITLICDELELPYQRPPLSKAFLLENLSGVDLHFCPLEFFERERIDLIRGDRATALNRRARTMQLQSGFSIPYDHVIFATGSRSRTLNIPGADLSGVFNLRTLEDARRLRARLPEARRVVVIGGGFIGLEFAAVATKLGLDVTLLEAGSRLLARSVTQPTAQLFEETHRSWGVKLEFGSVAVALHGKNGTISAIETSDSRLLPADIVLIGIGIQPNAEIAAAAGLAVDDGICVDNYLLTEDANISAIGDCARFMSIGGNAFRLESVQNALDQARAVASRLSGKPHPYSAVPWFWSDQRDLKLQIAGLTQDYDEIVVRGDAQAHQYAAFCFNQKKLNAVEAVNRPSDFMAVRRILEQGITVSPEQISDPAFDLRALVGGGRRG